jgi:adenylylsulfate kinase
MIEEEDNMAQGFTLWVTGLPASGKSEIARILEESLLERGLDVERVDEGELRERWLPGLGFQQAEEAGVTLLVGHICHLLTRNGVIAVAAAISPLQEVRNEIRSQIGPFVEVYLKCPAERCRQRDRTGNWDKARSGTIQGFVGVDRPYEEPVNPEVLLETDGEDVEDCVKQVLRTLEIMERIPREEGSDYNEEEEKKITKRLKDLGYI